MNEEADKKIVTQKNIDCGHDTKEGFHYDLDDTTRLLLCQFCNMNLAHGIMGQIALQIFYPTPTIPDKK